MANWGRTLRTLAHLRPSQVAHRLRYRVRRALWERNPAAVDARYRRRATALPRFRWDHPGLARVAAFRLALRSPQAALATARDACRHRFTFLGRSEDFGAAVDWFRPDLDHGTRLWKTQLHEFSYAVDLARAARETGDPACRKQLFDLARAWRAAAPIGCRDFALDAWNARAVATRLVHWAVAGQLLGLHAGPPGADPEADWLGREIGLHGLFLRDNLERDILGNHLWRDAVGLVFANELAGGVPDALRWLERQVAEQVLPDGCHVERAPMYHAICLQDLLEARLLLGNTAPAWLQDAIPRMGGLLEAILLGDGRLPLLGDGWHDEVALAPLLAAARACGPLADPREPERHGGLVPLVARPWKAVVRAGAHGPDYLLGHAHADLLSFELSRAERRVVCDTGTFCYDPGPERDAVRATEAHNTLRIDACEQIEAWGSFRVGRRGRARASGRDREGAWTWLAASHDAYRHRSGQPMHHRLIALGPTGALIIDCVTGTGVHRIESHLHRHPDGGDVPIATLLGAAAAEASAPLHEHFGETRTATRLRVDQTVQLPWRGGWRIGDLAREDAVTIAGRGDVVRIRIGGAHPLALDWRPGGRVARCPSPHGSAT